MSVVTLRMLQIEACTVGYCEQEWGVVHDPVHTGDGYQEAKALEIVLRVLDFSEDAQAICVGYPLYLQLSHLVQ